MYPVSSDFQKAIKSTRRIFALKLEIDTADDTFNLTDADVDMSTLKLNEGCAPNGSLELGTAQVAMLDVDLNNRNGQYNDVQFSGGIMKPIIGLELPSGDFEWVPLGVLNIDDVSRPTTSAHLGGSDNLILFDVAFAGVPISFPTTNKQLLAAVCNHVGVPLATTSFLNDDYVVQKAPSGTPSCRDIVKCIAELAAGYAQCDRTTGALKIMRFQNPGCMWEANIDGGDFLGIDHTASGSTIEYDGPFGTKITSIAVTGKTSNGHGVRYVEMWEGTLAGARNLALGTSSDYSTPYTNFNGGTNLCLDLAKVLVDGLSVGDTVTIHLLYKYDNIVAVSGQSDSVWMQGSGDVTGWGSGTIGAAGPTNFSGSGLFEIKRSFTVTADHLKNAYWDVTLRHDYIQSGSVQWKMFKVEKGNVADYSPAPEDLPSYQKIMSPQELLDGDSYDFITGQGTTAEKQPIIGTSQRLLTDGHTTITNDSGAQMQVGYNTMTGDNVDGGDFDHYNDKKVDGGAFVEPDPVVVLGPDNRYDFKIDDNPVTITGIVYEADNQDYVIGDRSYALHISDNALIQGDPTDVLNRIADVMIGFTYLPFTSSWQGNPALQPGDIIQQTDRNGVQYRTIVTNSSYAYRGVCNLSAKGASEIAHGFQSSQTKKATQLLRLIHEKQVKIDSLDQAILNATSLIAGALGSHWIDGDKLPDEKYHGNVFIADNPDITKAKKVWRWNLGGFGYSQTGVDGPYTTAITSDGSIVANIITASMIKTGRLESLTNPNVYFDLDEGVLCASKLVSPDNSAAGITAEMGSVNYGIGISYGLKVMKGSDVLCTMGTSSGGGVTMYTTGDYQFFRPDPSQGGIMSGVFSVNDHYMLLRGVSANFEGTEVAALTGGNNAVEVSDSGIQCSNGASGDVSGVTLHVRGGIITGWN